MERDAEVKALLERLAAPFPDSIVKWKPQSVSKDGKTAMGLPYIDARAVQERLDEVLGPENWQSEFNVMASGSVCCTLSIRLNGEWIKKSDAGGESDQDNQADRTKAAFSDSLKRAAVQFGIARHLYQLPKLWFPYDSAKKKFVNPPKLPTGRSGGGNPPAQNRGNNNNCGNNAASQKPTGATNNPKQAQKAAQGEKAPPGASQGPQPGSKQAPQQAARAAQQQIDRIDVLLGELKKPMKWMQDALMEKFGKQEIVDLTVDEADKVISGLEGKVSKKKSTAVDSPKQDGNTGSNPTAKSGGKTPPRQGKF